MKILFLDIETAPHLVHVWGLWNQNVGVPQIIDSGYVLCWSAKWYGEKEIMFDSAFHTSHKRMLRRIYTLLEEADVVVHYNGTKFDIPTLNKEFIKAGMTPPAPFKQIDLLKTARGQFRFPSNKLDYVAKALGLGGKKSHKGHELWIGCMNNDPESWDQMAEYNIRDVELLEQVYEKLKPWIKGHPNTGLFSGAGMVCPTCGGTHFTKRGFTYTLTRAFQRFRCKDCGTWFRGKEQVKTPDTFRND